MLDPSGNFISGLPAIPSTPATPTLYSSGAPDYINYAGPPTAQPPAVGAIVIDSNNRVWTYSQSTKIWQ